MKKSDSLKRQVSEAILACQDKKAEQVTDLKNMGGRSSWSPDGTKIMCARRLGDMNVVIFPAPK